MADDFPSVAELAAEEQDLQVRSFTNDDAWELGSALVAAARERSAPVVVDVTRNGHQLFHAALSGSTPDNDTWIARKQRVVHRFGHSSLYVRQASFERGTTFEAEFGLDPGSTPRTAAPSRSSSGPSGRSAWSRSRGSPSSRTTAWSSPRSGRS